MATVTMVVPFVRSVIIVPMRGVLLRCIANRHSRVMVIGVHLRRHRRFLTLHKASDGRRGFAQFDLGFAATGSDCLGDTVLQVIFQQC